MQRIGSAVLLFLLSVTTFITPLSAQNATNNRNRAENYVKKGSSALAPVYGPLAEHLVNEYALSSRIGVGIDIGGGPGDLSVELARRTTGMRWINSDINPALFTHSADKAKAAGVDGRVSFTVADATKLPFRDNYADIIVSRGSFQFWKDIDKAFSEIYRVLKPGCPAYIGRGFSENLPVNVARDVRKNQGGGPKYDKEKTAVMLAAAAKSRGFKDFRIIMPSPAGSDGVNYGVWIEFFKEGPRTVPKKSPAAVAVSSGNKKTPLYVIEPMEIRGTAPRDVIAEPSTEAAALEITKSVVTGEDIERQGAKNIVEALDYVPGAWVETRGRKVKQFFSVRGQKYPYPEYAIDGALFREFHEVPYFFSTADIDRIEVLRSSAAMLSGVSGLTGIVNIVPKTYTKPETSWDIEYGSFDTYRGRLSHGATVGKATYSLSVDTPHTNGPDGKNAAENMSNFKASLSFKPRNDLDISANIFHINGRRELRRAEDPAASKFQQTVERFDPFRTTFANLKTLYHPDDKKSTELQLFYADRNHVFQNDTSDGHTANSEHDFEWGLNLIQSYALTENNTLRGSIYYNHWMAPNGKRFFAGKKCDLHRYSATVADEHRIGRLTLDGAIRLERTYIEDYGAFGINGSAKGFGKVTPITDEWEPIMLNASMGAAWHMSPALSLFANAVVGEIKARDGSRDINGDTPSNERRIKLDLGVRTFNSRFGEASIAAFLSRQDDAIVLSGKTETYNGQIMELYLNRDQYTNGIELDTKSTRLFNVARFFLNATVMNPEMKTDDGWKENKEMPGFIGSAGVNADYQRYDLSIYLKHVSEYESTRFAADSSVPVDLGDYTTVNMTAGVRLYGRPATRIYLEIKNLTDEEFSTVVGFPDFGRTYTVGLRQTF